MAETEPLAPSGVTCSRVLPEKPFHQAVRHSLVLRLRLPVHESVCCSGYSVPTGIRVSAIPGDSRASSREPSASAPLQSGAGLSASFLLRGHDTEGRRPRAVPPRRPASGPG